MKLALKALLKFAIGLLLVGGLLFLSAGTFKFYNAWIFILLLFVPIFILGMVLLFKSPVLLEKRLNGKEDQALQKGVVALSGFLFFVGFVISGLDFRFEWSYVPGWVVAVASFVLLGSYGLYAEVMRENAYLSRTVEVQAGQKLIDTGLYGIVRHPMYAVTIWLFLSIPLVLGSLWAFLCFLPYVVIIAFRIKNEEQVLEQGLPEYAEYKKRVKYRLFPFIW